MQTSTLTYNQTKQYRAEYTNEHEEDCVLIATVRHDDRCKNGHNTFSITGELYDIPHRIHGEASVKNAKGKTLWLVSCGCIHQEIAERIPELAPLIKWHLTSTDGPMYYVANTMYHVIAADLESARSCAVWPDAELEDFTEEKLKARLPALMEEFKRDVESFGFIY